jgi:hypothetical protein
MLMGRILGGIPSNMIVPLTDPAVAMSTGVPPVAAGVAAGVSGWVSPPPQLKIPIASAMVAEKISRDLPFISASSYSDDSDSDSITSLVHQPAGRCD